MSKNANFKHGSQTLVTPTELKKLAKLLLDPEHEDFGDPYGGGNTLYETGADKWSASGECEQTSRWTKPYFPAGTQTLEMVHHKEESWISTVDGTKKTAPISNHYVNVVPTTEGPHVVDFTHRQFQNTAGLPVVQHINDFMQRASMKGYILDQEQLSPTLKENLGE
jgi:hypothetical protein